MCQQQKNKSLKTPMDSNTVHHTHNYQLNNVIKSVKSLFTLHKNMMGTGYIDTHITLYFTNT